MYAFDPQSFTLYEWFSLRLGTEQRNRADDGGDDRARRNDPPAALLPQQVRALDIHGP